MNFIGQPNDAPGARILRDSINTGSSRPPPITAEIEHNKLRSAAIMPHGFSENVTQITGLPATAEVRGEPAAAAH
ncbi:MAG TPA: hypothetical protein VFO94_03180 [Gammaproteobacteria bacterium]|nr:hypothetical protein [Gammaproteobacteria bacterium]